jgi:hypothetical protein
MANDYISRQNVQLEIMSDGTLHITATVDVANTNRILLSQAGTHLGDLYYRDDERTKGKWIDNYTTCSECGWQMIDDVIESPNIVAFNFCPNCGARMEEEK